MRLQEGPKGRNNQISLVRFLLFGSRSDVSADMKHRVRSQRVEFQSEDLVACSLPEVTCESDDSMRQPVAT